MHIAHRAGTGGGCSMHDMILYRNTAVALYHVPHHSGWNRQKPPDHASIIVENAAACSGR